MENKNDRTDKKVGINNTVNRTAQSRQGMNAGNVRRQASAKPQTAQNKAPAQKQPARQDSKTKKLSEEEIKALKEKQRAAEAQRLRILREEAKRKALLKKQKRERLGAYLVLILITFVLLTMIFVTVFYVNLVSHKNPDLKDYPLVLSDYDDSLTVEAGYIVGENGNRYVNFSQIAEFYGFGMVGSIDDMKYVIKGDESETISFSVGSDKAFINDVQVRMPGKAEYINGDLYVDMAFLTTYTNGLIIQNDEENKGLSVSKILLNPVDAEGKITDGNPPDYEDVSFKLKAPMTSLSISENDTAVEIPTYEFNSDLSAYEKYMNPGSTTEFLTLVNSEHKLGENHIPTGLSMLENTNGMYLKDYAAKSFAAMYKEATACGIVGLSVTKAYKSYDEIAKQYQSAIDEFTLLIGADQAKRYADATVAAPGTDEHQAGLTVDLALSSGINFETSTAYAWLKDNSYKFGFVQRYPDGKKEQSAYGANSNQFRYVGRYHAVRMNALGYSLEEYVEYLGL